MSLLVSPHCLLAFSREHDLYAEILLLVSMHIGRVVEGLLYLPNIGLQVPSTTGSDVASVFYNMVLGNRHPPRRHLGSAQPRQVGARRLPSCLGSDHQMP